MGQYSEEMKKSFVVKLCSPNNPPSAYQLAKESGISQSSLLKWKKEFGNAANMIKKNKRSQDWTPEEKLQAVMESMSLSDEELGSFLRTKGLHSHQLKDWRREVLESLGGKEKKAKGRPTKDPKLRMLEDENKALKRDLCRKEKALAESAALLWLKKKADDIWGDDEDEE